MLRNHPGKGSTVNSELSCQFIPALAHGDELWREWTDLLDRVRPEHRLFGPDWYSVWSRTWGAAGRWTGRLSLISVRDRSGQLCGILPIGRPRVGPLSVYSFGGNDQPGRPILAEANRETEVGRAIGNFIAGTRWPLLQIAPVVRGDAAISAMLDALKQRGVFLQRLREEQLAISNTPETWDEFRDEVLGTKFDRRIDYYERRTAREGEMSITHYRQPTAGQMQLMLDQLAGIEQRSWLAKADRGKPRFCAEAARSMWQQLSEAKLSSADQIDCWVMSVDDLPISFCFTLTSGDTRYVLANNYDEDFKVYSTGSVLYRCMMRDGIERGIRRYDFGSGELHYKSRWGAVAAESLDTWIAAPLKPAGVAVRLVSAFRDWRRKRNLRPESVEANTESSERSPAGTSAAVPVARSSNVVTENAAELQSTGTL